MGAFSFTGSPVELRPGQNIKDGTGDLLPGTPGAGYAIPCVADWNGDGRKDLLVGHQGSTGGKIALYLNQGTDAAPAFTNFTRLKTGAGRDIQHNSSGCGSPAPWVCDFDADGRRDLLVGAGSDGTVFFYRNTNSDVAPVLDSGRKLDIAGSPLSVGEARAVPYYYDLDRDGLNDLVVGAGDGCVYFFRNTNSMQNPLFAPAAKVQAGGVTLDLGMRSVVRAFDWDADGIEDLVASSDTGVFWCRREADGSFAAPQVLRAADLSAGNLLPVAPVPTPGARMRIDLTDWNNDGSVDLLVGATPGTVTLYEGYQFRITSSVRRGTNLELCWNSAPGLKYNLLIGGEPTGCPSYSNVLSGGNLTRWTNQVDGHQHLLRVQIADPE